jgi:hypothetical protein
VQDQKCWENDDVAEKNLQEQIETSGGKAVSSAWLAKTQSSSAVTETKCKAELAVVAESKVQGSGETSGGEAVSSARLAKTPGAMCFYIGEEEACEEEACEGTYGSRRWADLSSDTDSHEELPKVANLCLEVVKACQTGQQQARAGCR